MNTKQQLVLGNETTKVQKFAYDTTKILLASLLIGLAGILSFDLPFTRVPVTFQIQMVLLTAAILGSKRAFLATATFLLQGAMGWPVFAGGYGGVHVFFGPTGGYLIGYLLAAYFTGLIVEKSKAKSTSKLFLHFSLGNFIVYCCGAYMISMFVGFKNALLLGVFPFLLGDVIKTMIIIKVYQKIRR